MRLTQTMWPTTHVLKMKMSEKMKGKGLPVEDVMKMRLTIKTAIRVPSIWTKGGHKNVII